MTTATPPVPVPRLDDEPGVEAPVDWRDCQVRGAPAHLMTCTADEVLIDGPAGTGKSFGICVHIVQLCVKHAGLRVLMARKTRQSMSETILVTFEAVLKMFGLTAVYGNKKRGNRDVYHFPNGTTVVVVGFDDAERIKSSDYDLAYVNEGTEISEADWLIVTTRLRHTVDGEFIMGYTQGIIDCNPGPPTHWLLARHRDSGMKKFKSVHKDNPVLFKTWVADNGKVRGAWTKVGRSYMRKLDALTGVTKKRMRDGLWVMAEGAVFEKDWDNERHIVPRSRLPEPDRVAARWCSVDWGFRDPGVINLWTIGRDERIYRERSIYRTQKTINWWIAQAKRLMRDYPDIQGFICDGSRPDYLEMFRLAGIPTLEADRSAGTIEVGITLIRQRLANQGDGGGPGLLFIAESTGWYADGEFAEQVRQDSMTWLGEEERADVHVDPWEKYHNVESVAAEVDTAAESRLGGWVPQIDKELRKKSWPCTHEDEFYSYAYPDQEPEKPTPRTKQETPLDKHNHGMDTLRYILLFIAGEYHGTSDTDPDGGMKPLVDEELEDMI